MLSTLRTRNIGEGAIGSEDPQHCTSFDDFSSNISFFLDGGLAKIALRNVDSLVL